MTSVQVSYKAFDVALMLRRCIMVCAFEFGVADKGLAMFAPIFGLQKCQAQSLKEVA